MFSEIELMHASPYSADEQTPFLSGRCQSDLQQALPVLVLMPDSHIQQATGAQFKQRFCPRPQWQFKHGNKI